MGLLDDLEQRLFQQLAKLLEPILSPLRRLFAAVKSFFTALIDLLPESIHLFHSVVDEISAWRNFREQVNFKSGVISPSSVKEHIQDLIDEVIASWHALLSIWTGAKLNPLEQVQEASTALADVLEEFGHIGRFSEFLKNVGPKIEKVGGKVFEVLAIVQQIAETILDVVRKLQTVVDTITDIRETFETGKGLFLKQTNPRQTLTLEDGSKIRIRVGNLH